MSRGAEGCSSLFDHSKRDDWQIGRHRAVASRYHGVRVDQGDLARILGPVAPILAIWIEAAHDSISDDRTTIA